jgi:hypothetical protein
VLVHNSTPCPISALFGLTDEMGSFVSSVRGSIAGRIDIFPFVRLSDETASAWQGIRQAMQRADNIHFNLGGMTPEAFADFVRRGGFRGTPQMGLPGQNWTNRELYEILSNPNLLNKTQFHNGSIDAFRSVLGL